MCVKKSVYQIHTYVIGNLDFKQKIFLMKYSTQHTIILSSEDCRQVIEQYGIDTLTDKLIAKTIEAIKDYHPEKTQIPARSGFHYETPHTGLIEWMPLLDKDEQVVIKVVGYHPSNPKINNLPTILSTISAYDTASGHLLSIADGVLLTALRTGAASAVASKYLAHPDSKVLGIIGCGAQAVTQLHALSRLFNFEKVLIYDIDTETMLSFKTRCECLKFNAQIQLSTVEEIVTASDILCTATSIEPGAGPLFENLPTQPHLHINAVGSDFPGKIELPLGLLEQSFICPDFTEQALAEGECQQLKRANIDADLTEIVQNPNGFRQIPNQKSVFDSTGWALEDRVVLDLFTECADELGVGTTN